MKQKTKWPTPSHSSSFPPLYPEAAKNNLKCKSQDQNQNIPWCSLYTLHKLTADAFSHGNPSTCIIFDPESARMIIMCQWEMTKMLLLLKQVLILGVVFHLLVNVFPSLAEYGGMVYTQAVLKCYHLPVCAYIANSSSIAHRYRV